MKNIIKVTAVLAWVLMNTAMQVPFFVNPVNLQEEEITPPQFPGGNQALLAYIQSNIIYPETAKEQGIEGRVMISFTINKEGKISNVAPILPKEKQLGHGLEDAAVQLIQKMPPWTPAYNIQLEEAVSYDMVLPIFFKLK